jgi:hypothetical protein
VVTLLANRLNEQVLEMVGDHSDLSSGDSATENDCALRAAFPYGVSTEAARLPTESEE